MEIPLEITFHDVPASDEIEALIREHVARLEKLYPRMVGCRVAVEMRHKQHRTGNVPEVHIEMHVPQRDIVVSREPRHARQRRAAADLHTSIHDAFKVAEKQLKEFKRQQNGDVKVKEAPLRGYVSELIAEKNYGFIARGNGEDIYFHRNSVADDAFDGLREGDAVQYTVAPGDKGPSAGRVWRTAEAAVSKRARRESEAKYHKS